MGLAIGLSCTRVLNKKKNTKTEWVLNLVEKLLDQVPLIYLAFLAPLLSTSCLQILPRPPLLSPLGLQPPHLLTPEDDVFPMTQANLTP